MLNYQRVSFSFPSRVLETRDVAHEGADLPAQDWGCLAHRKLGSPPQFFSKSSGLLWLIMAYYGSNYGLFRSILIFVIMFPHWREKLG